MHTTDRLPTMLEELTRFGLFVSMTGVAGWTIAAVTLWAMGCKI